MIKYHSYAPTYGLCIDWESSGSDFLGNSALTFQGLSFGAIIFNTRTFEIVDELYVEIKFDETTYQWSNDAQKIHGLTREYLAEHGVEREEACVLLMEFLLKHLGPNPKVMVLGFNTGFDINFTEQLFNDFGVEFKSHHVVLDVAGMSFICFGTYKSDHVFELFGNDKRAAHNALEDARMTLEVARQYNAIFKDLMA